MAKTSSPELVSVKERDYLDQDPPIRGQSYACISFVSPEEVLANKDAFVFSAFVKDFAADAGQMLSNLAAKFPEESETVRLVRERHAALLTGDPAEMGRELASFKSLNGARLDDEFHKSPGNGFRTSIRGFKIRGVYDSVEAATARAKAVKRFDDKFHVYVTEVGCWCPWSPNPEEIAESEYAETQLNTLVKRYNENQQESDAAYEDRKGDMIKRMDVEREVWLEKCKAELAASGGERPAANAGIPIPTPPAPLEVAEGTEGPEGAQSAEEPATHADSPSIPEETQETQKGEGEVASV